MGPLGEKVRPSRKIKKRAPNNRVEGKKLAVILEQTKRKTNFGFNRIPELVASHLRQALEPCYLVVGRKMLQAPLETERPKLGPLEQPQLAFLHASIVELKLSRPELEPGHSGPLPLLSHAFELPQFRPWAKRESERRTHLPGSYVVYFRHGCCCCLRRCCLHSMCALA